LLIRLLQAVCKSRDELVLENLALRQQVSALELGKHKPKLHDADRAFWIALRKAWSNWTSGLRIVKPDTVVDVVVVRGGERRTLTVTLGRRPSGR